MNNRAQVYKWLLMNLLLRVPCDGLGGGGGGGGGGGKFRPDGPLGSNADFTFVCDQKHMLLLWLTNWFR